MTTKAGKQFVDTLCEQIGFNDIIAGFKRFTQYRDMTEDIYHSLMNSYIEDSEELNADERDYLWQKIKIAMDYKPTSIIN